MKLRMQKTIIFTALALSALQAHAAPKAPGFAHPPYHINPNPNMLLPSGLSPSQVRNAYGFSAVAFQGAGQVIGIVDAFDDPNIEQDLGVFNTTFNLPACTTANGCFQKVYASGTRPPTDAGWSVEIALDVEWAHAIAPQAKILLVEAASNSLNDLIQAVRVAVSKGAHVISMSWGGSEFSSESQFDRNFNVLGVTFTAASGDSGHERIYPAASPYVLSVGGTRLSVDSAGHYLGETAWSGSGGGLSLFENWLGNQSTFPIPNDPNGKRGIPDVAYDADPATGFAVYDSVSFQNKSGWFIVGGTSAGAPQWAAFVALANNAVGKYLNINTVLYRIGKLSTYTSNYNDIVTGTNGSCGYYCSTFPGYDYVTGLGTPKVPALLNSIVKAYNG